MAASSSLCLVELSSSTTQLMKEDIPLISKPPEMNSCSRLGFKFLSLEPTFLA